MTRPRHVYLLNPDEDEDEDEDLLSSQPGSVSPSPTIRRVPSYRPLPIPGAATAFHVTASATCDISAPTRPLPSVRPLSIPTRPVIQPALPSPTHKPGHMQRSIGLRESSSQPPSPSSPQSPQSPFVTAAAASWQRYKPRSNIRIPSSAVELSSSDDVEEGVNSVEISPSSSARRGFSPTPMTTAAVQTSNSQAVRPRVRSPTSPTFATSLASVSVSTSTSASAQSSVSAPFVVTSNHSILTPSSSPTTSTFPPSSFPLPSPSTSVSTPSHQVARKSRSKLNLKSQSSQSALRPKRSKMSLLPPAPPSPEVVVKRGHNTNPYKVFVNRLPPELLSVVFLLLISSTSSATSSCSSEPANAGRDARLSIGGGTSAAMDAKSPRTISQVCYLWRCVALNEPLLWARTLNLREGPRWIIETLRRSGECTIDVVGLRDGLSSTTVTRFPSGSSGDRNSRDGIGDNYSGGAGGRGTVGRTSVLGVVLNELKRIRKLHLTIERKEEWKWFLDVVMKEEAPVLESLAMKSLVRRGTGGRDGHGLMDSHGGSFGSSLGGGFGSGIGFDMDGFDFGVGDDSMKLTEGIFRGKAPKLRSLSLSMVSLSTLLPLPYLSSLTALQITDLEDAYQMDICSWLSIVRQTPLLYTLILRSVFSPEIPTEAETASHTNNVVLKKLRYVELKGTLMECCEFLEKLVIPGECKLMMGCNRANNANAVVVLGDWMRERKRRSEHMEGILKSPWEVMKEDSERRTRSLLVHPSVTGLVIKVNEGGMEEDEGECVVNLDFAFGFVDPQNEERHRIVIEIFDVLTRALQMVYEDKGGFDALNLSLFEVRDGIKIWGDQLVQFLALLDRVEHLQEMSGYTASIVFPLLVHSPQQQHQRRGSTASNISTSSTSTSRQNTLLPLLSKVTLAFVEFGENVDDEFEASCDVHVVPDFVRRRYGLAGSLSVIRQRAGSVKVRFECCSGPKSILDELRRLGVEYGLGWACDFDLADNFN